MMLQQFYQTKYPEAGCDEAGRGCLAGPVYAAAVILPKKFYHPLLNDSKQIKEADRLEMRYVIESKAIAFGVAAISHSVIDKINILQASIKAMHDALDMLDKRPKYIIVDGNKFNDYYKIPNTCIIQGDSLFNSIAAASILAKTYRDEYMLTLDKKFPQYGWVNNKGYATAMHRAAIKEFGLSPYHRVTFRLKEDIQIELFKELENAKK
jgi:ribonuclease HII